MRLNLESAYRFVPAEAENNPEDIDIKEITNENEIELIKEFINTSLEKRVIIGQGSVADIYNDINLNEIIPEDDQGAKACLKINERGISFGQASLRDEAFLQETAYRILENSRQKSESVANVPKPLFLFEGEIDEQHSDLLLMEQIPGRTIWRIMAEAAVVADPELEKKVLESDRWNTEKMTDTEFDEMLIELIHEEATAGGIQTNEVDPEVVLKWIYKRISKFVEKTGIIGKETFKKIKRTIEVLNKSGFFHRDLHPKNLMIGDDGEVYFIDFGKARYSKNNLGTNNPDLPDDDTGFLTEISSLVKKERPLIRSFTKNLEAEGQEIIKDWTLELGEDPKIQEMIAMYALKTADQKIDRNVMAFFRQKFQRLHYGLIRLTQFDSYDIILKIALALSKMEKEQLGTREGTKQMMTEFCQRYVDPSKQEQFKASVLRKLAQRGR